MMKFHYSLILINLILLPLSACQFSPSIPSRPQQKTMVIESQKSMYSHRYLEQQNARLTRRINNELFRKGIKPHLTAQERQKLNNVTFRFPLIGEVSQTPQDFYSNSEQKSVVMPILSLVFFEDLYTAYAWLHTNGYSVETIDEYVTMLKYKKPSDFPNGRYPSPLEALQIPKNALENKQVDELSLRFRNTAYSVFDIHLGQNRNGK